MKTIYKYGPVTTYYDTIVQGRIVHVGMQSDGIYVWAEQGENLPPSKVKYVGTGMPYNGVYIGTVFEAGGMLVWHVIKENM
jgi:hypothetical protein